MPRIRRLTCTVCPRSCDVEVSIEQGQVVNVQGYSCKRGLDYAKEECTSPKRVLTSVVGVRGGDFPVTSVKTTKRIPKGRVRDLQYELSKVTLDAPVVLGRIVLRNALGLDSDVVVTRSVKRSQKVTFQDNSDT